MVNTNTGQHEPGAKLCIPSEHCHSCNKDEGGPGYLACLECGHLFRTGWNLRREYIYLTWQITRLIPRRKGQRSDLVLLVRAVFRRAKNIHSCPKCSHSF